MPDISFKSGDTRPKLVFYLKEGSITTTMSLTTATSARFLMRFGSTTIIKTGTACQITNAAIGEVTVTLAAVDTNVIGIYNAEIEITWSDGGIETVPNTGFVTIEVLDDIA